MRDAKAPLVPLTCVLRQLAKELAGADQHVEAMEAVVQREVLGKNLGSQQLSDLQGIDHMRQTLVCLGAFLENLSESIEITLLVNSKAAAETLTLEALSKRLACPNLSPAAGPESGSLHLF